MNPKRPTGPRRPSRPRPVASSKSTPMSRSRAQTLRFSGSQPSLTSMVKRIIFWQKMFDAQAKQEADILGQDQGLLGHADPGSDTLFATANMKQATLRDGDPNATPGDGMTNMPGVDPATGFIPPPPP